MRTRAVGAIGVVEDERRADLADRRGAKALRARQLQYGLFIQVVAAKMLVDIADHRIVLDEGHDGVAGGFGHVTGKNRVLNVSVSPRKCPGAMPAALGMVKV